MTQFFTGLLIAGLLFTAAACGGGDAVDNGSPTPAEKRSRREAARAPQEAPPVEQEKGKPPSERTLQSAALTPEVGGAADEYKVVLQTLRPLKEDQRLAYIFWNNSRPMGESARDSLPPLSCKRGDVIFADALLYQDDRLVEKARTPIQQVLNAAPVVKDVVFPDVKDPGTYKWTIIAEDPDGDTITFSLEGENLPGNLSIDAATGVITGVLDQDSPTDLTFLVAVADGFGAVTRREITNKFFKQKVSGD